MQLYQEKLKELKEMTYCSGMKCAQESSDGSTFKKDDMTYLEEEMNKADLDCNRSVLSLDSTFVDLSIDIKEIDDMMKEVGCKNGRVLLELEGPDITMEEMYEMFGSFGFSNDGAQLTGPEIEKYLLSTADNRSKFVAPSI